MNMSANLKEVPSQTIESFIKQNGGIIRFLQHATLAYGMTPEVFHNALKLAKQQGYQTVIDKDTICTFQYYKQMIALS